MSEQELRSKLQSGMTIEEVCTEYQISFKDLVDLLKCDQYRTTNKPVVKGRLYITEHYGYYIVRKAGVYYGMYRTLSDAKKVRDWFITHRWDKNKVDVVCRILGVERCKK